MNTALLPVGFQARSRTTMPKSTVVPFMTTLLVPLLMVSRLLPVPLSATGTAPPVALAEAEGAADADAEAEAGPGAEAEPDGPAVALTEEAQPVSAAAKATVIAEAMRR